MFPKLLILKHIILKYDYTSTNDPLAFGRCGMRFHGGNTGSIPVGRANDLNDLGQPRRYSAAISSSFLQQALRHSGVAKAEGGRE